MARTKTDKRLEAARIMPPLSRLTSSDYSFKHDEVAKWIAENKDLMNYFIDFLARNSYITYDHETHKWEGNRNGK